jgi:Sulfatase
MGYETPNIDRIGKEGAMFTDWYGQQSCTAGRAAFVTGQSPIRTGPTKVGLPGADVGLRPQDPTVAEILKQLGYATGQFGKNHLGDKDEFLPTNHGFDEFFGNLYHLNAEEEPENPDYPKNPEFRKSSSVREGSFSIELRENLHPEPNCYASAWNTRGLSSFEQLAFRCPVLDGPFEVSFGTFSTTGKHQYGRHDHLPMFDRQGAPFLCSRFSIFAERLGILRILLRHPIEERI